MTSTRQLSGERSGQISRAIAPSRPDGHATVPEHYLGTIQLPRIDPFSMDQYGLTGGIGRSDAISEIGTLLELVRYMCDLCPATLELQRNRDHVVLVSFCVEHNEVASSAAPLVGQERQIRVNNDSLSGQASRIHATFISAQRLAEITFPDRCADSAEDSVRASRRDSSSSF